jgi:hypothetical protein
MGQHYAEQLTANSSLEWITLRVIHLPSFNLHPPCGEGSSSYFRVIERALEFGESKPVFLLSDDSFRQFS